MEKNCQIEVKDFCSLCCLKVELIMRVNLQNSVKKSYPASFFKGESTRTKTKMTLLLNLLYYSFKKAWSGPINFETNMSCVRRDAY